MCGAVLPGLSHWRPGRLETPEEVPDEFLWLFEYALEMDTSILNSAERLNGLALLYGPAVLKGYEITFDVIRSRAGAMGAASIVSSRKPEAEVWGVLYRIPRRLIESSANEPALLDKIHFAAPPDGLFERLSVEVHETYRGREILCITYIASTAARNAFHLLPRDRQGIDTYYIQRLLEIAKKQKLPGDYLAELALLPASDIGRKPPAPGTGVEQSTEPLPILVDEKRTQLPTDATQKASPTLYGRGMVIFALYLVLALLSVFIFALLQGLGIGAHIFPAGFAPLGAPWFVAVYGFLGGCLSCIVHLGRHSTSQPPTFVLITWLARPLIGIVLAIAVYLFLNSGLFVPGGNDERHFMLYSLLALLAASCEGWLFYKRR